MKGVYNYINQRVKRGEKMLVRLVEPDKFDAMRNKVMQ